MNALSQCASEMERLFSQLQSLVTGQLTGIVLGQNHKSISEFVDVFEIVSNNFIPDCASLYIVMRTDQFNAFAINSGQISKANIDLATASRKVAITLATFERYQSIPKGIYIYEC